MGADLSDGEKSDKPIGLIALSISRCRKPPILGRWVQISRSGRRRFFYMIATKPFSDRLDRLNHNLIVPLLIHLHTYISMNLPNALEFRVLSQSHLGGLDPAF